MSFICLYLIINSQQSMKEKLNNKNLKPQQKKKFKPQPNNKPSALKQQAVATQSNLIDSIFKDAKHKKIIKKQQTNQSEIQQKKQKKLQLKLKKQWKIQQQLRQANQGADLVGQNTSGGIKIYTEEQLSIGKGGNSKLCPFDCNCCF